MLIGIETHLTETVTPPIPTMRYRKRFHTMGVIDAFILNEAPESYSQNLYLYDGVLFSYGRHYPLARWVRRIGDDSLRFVLVRVKGGSVTTETKHRSPLIQTLFNSHWSDIPLLPFVVEDVMADSPEGHARNYRGMLLEAEREAAKASRGPKILREGKAAYAADRLLRAFLYANTVGLTGKPDSDTPHGALSDWLQESEPELVNLRRCVASLCPITGRPL